MSMETQDLEVWLRDRAAEALRIPAGEIDPVRPLIDQGLDSLGAIELGQAVETALGVALPPGSLLEGASLRDLTLRGSGGGAPLPVGGGAMGEGSGVRSGGGRLSHTQRGLWFLHRLHPKGTAYHLSTIARVLGDVPNETLRATFQGMVDRHPALRTTFPLAGDEPVQVIPDQAGDVAFEEIDASGWSGEELHARMEEAAFRPFDLERGPIFRASLFDRGAERFLVASMHHIVSDFGALANLVLEAPREGGKSFAQFVDWQAEMLAGPEGARLEAFWRERLAGLPELDLPADRVKPASAPEQAGAAWREIGPETLVRLKALARSRGATLYVVLLAAFQTLLHRYTGQEDFAVGSPVAGRPAGYGRVFGYFTNPVVLRAEMEGDPPFRELVGRVRRRVVEALDNQHFPLPLLVERLRARSELFRVLFVLHKAPPEAEGLVSFSLGNGGGRLRVGGFELESLPLGPRGSQFDMTLAAGEHRGLLGLQVIYDAARFDAPTIARWLQHLDNLVTGAAEWPDTPLSELPLLSPWERHQLLHEVNDGSEADLPWSTLHEAFERQAARTPAAIALIDGERRLTYRELDAQASALAGDLRRRGAGPERVVAVKLPRTAELIVALLGVLKAGAAYLPLDPSYPEERIAFMLEDAGAVVVLEGDQTDRTDPSDPSDSPPLALPGSLAYLIYTSGSTGRPKGVAIEHAAAVRLVAWAGRAFSRAELRGVLAATSVNFDLSIFEIFVPLSFGGTVILAENALALPELPARDEVTLINTVPSAVAGLLEMGPLPPSVRTVNLAGEPLRRSLADRVIAAGVKLWDLYGPSEDTTYSTGAVVAAGDPFEPLIGWPLAGSRAYVLGRMEQGFRSLPLGVPGELCLGGGGLARGYLGRPALTAEKFVPSPFGDAPGSRLYRTGDLVRRRFDGALEYLGRIDHQVKIRGFRIELGEVEAALLAVPGVREAVVVARNGSLAAYVAFDGEPPAQPEEALREALRERLPAPFVPSFFVVLDALPRTPNGKVDRKALPVPAILAEATVEAPVGPVETAVAAVWAGVLDRDRIGRSESFFDLGGHSLLATRVMARVREALGVDLPLTALFDAPTVAGLAARIDADRPLPPVAFEVRTEPPPLVRLPRFSPFTPPLSYAQLRLWILDRLAPGNPAYNVTLAARLEGSLDPGLLARAFGEVARRHEAVRTTYESLGDNPVQIVHPPPPVPLPVAGLEGLPEAVRESEAHRLAREEELLPFDLESGPVLRARLLRLAPEEHVLLVSLHHIACDEWSIRLLFQEVVTLYGAWSEGRPAVLPDLPVQYADFAVWQRGWLTGPVLASQLAFWRSRLGNPPVLALPADRPRPPQQTFRGARISFALPAETSAALLALGHHVGATAFMTLLAAWQTLLARMTGQTDLTVGTPITGRTHVEVESLIGFFLNTLVLRAGLSGDPGFGEMVERTRAHVLEAFANQDLPFEKLVDEMGVPRSLGHSPLFQVLFVLLHTTPEPTGAAGLRATPFEIEGATAKFDLTLAVRADGEHLTGEIEYSTDLFDRTTILRLAERFRLLCAGAARDPERPLSRLPVLSEAEEHQVLRELNDRPPLHDVSVRLPDLIAAWAAREPERIAVEWDGGSWSYGDLVHRARELADRLREKGVGPDVPVGVQAHRGPELAVAFLAILLAGGAYLPIDPAYPTERQDFMLEDSGAPITLTPSPSPANGRGEQGKELSVKRVSRGAFHPSPARGRGAGGEGSSYLIYTSGSTGQPKGVIVPHRVLTNLILWQIDPDRPGGLPGPWRTLQLSSTSFDVSLQEMLATWCAGGTLVLVSDEERRDPERLARLLVEKEIERIFLPYVALRQLTEVLARPEAPVPAGLRRVITAGEPLQVTPQVAEGFRRLSAATGGTALHNQYGPSETHVVTELVLDGDPAGWPAAPSVGRPVAGTSAYVLDEALEPVPIGVAGELVLGGFSPARGYLGRPDQTAARFIPDPWSGGVPGARLYRSGDMARLLPDGRIDLLGRIDQQVKIRGYRVEPGEIEAVLAASPQVAEAVVLAVSDGSDRSDGSVGSSDRSGKVLRLAAFVVLAPGEEPVPAGLREMLRARLPEYMVPAGITVLDKLPLTPSGKVDRRALAALEPAAEEALERVVPRDPVEEMVASIWSDVLGIAEDRIGMRDDFFALGGHSLLATRIVSRLRLAFDVEVRLRDVLERPTVEALAGRIREVLGDQAAGPVAPALVHRPRRTEPPLSFAQLRLWIIDRIEPGAATYNVPLAVRLEGDLDPGLLARAFGEVALRHEAVRTTFGVRGGDPVQIVHPPAPVPVPVADLIALPEAAREREARRLAHEEEVRPFDLERGPVLRAGLIRLAPEEHVLLLTLHHIACDEWSLRLLFREAVALLAAWREGRSAVLPELPVQYADFAVWQRGWLTGPVLASQLAFWQSRLSDPPVLELPTDRPRPRLQTFRGARISFALPDETSGALLDLARRRSATAFMTLLAAWQALLARTSGQTDLTVGTPITGRTRVEVENLIGFFLNTLVLRADLSGDPGFGEIVDRTRARALEAFAHQDLPFEKLVDEIGVRRSLGHSPLFQTLFVLLHATPQPADSAGLRVVPFRTEGATAKFDLTLSVHAEGESLSGVLEYNTDLFDRSTVLRLAGRFGVLCAAAAREPERPLSDLPLLPEAEEHQILREHNDRLPLHDVSVRLHDLVAAWAERDPERPAVEWEEGTWSYAEFVGRARELAARLRDLGVGPDVPVGVAAGRGPELPVAFLAILMAGGAYLPIDPAYPAERQAFMLEDSGAPVVLDKDLKDIKDPKGSRSLKSLKSLMSLDTPAYVVYTSGSTGRPKGIAVPHRVLTNLILWQIDPSRPNAMPAPRRTLQFSSPSFDVSLHEMLSTWCVGGTLVLASEDDRRDPERLARLLAEKGIERLFLPYVALQQLADRLARPETPVPDRLRWVLTAGEQLQVTPQVVEAFRRLSAATGGTALHNHYGPSETHVVTELVLEGDPARWPAVPSIGRPIAGVPAYVLDRALNPVPLGVPGELSLGGFCPARGYLGRPEQTAEKFIPDAWSGVPGARLYRSGDLARLLPDGNIEFLGRIDHQVKIRGYRVEPGEIEAVLAKHPRVRECAVAVREERGERRLVAWFVPDGEVEATELRDHLRGKLPDPMVPSAFVKLDAMPLTTTGKVQRSALPAPEGERLAAAPYVEPRTTLEREIATVLREELGLDRVGREDNFFDLGGHSLTMVRAAARLTGILGRPVAVLDLFRSPTVASLARQLGGEEEALPARETLEERAETRRQSLGRRRELRRGR